MLTFVTLALKNANIIMWTTASNVHRHVASVLRNVEECPDRLEKKPLTLSFFFEAVTISHYYRYGYHLAILSA